MSTTINLTFTLEPAAIIAVAAVGIVYLIGKITVEWEQAKKDK